MTRPGSRPQDQRDEVVGHLLLAVGGLFVVIGAQPGTGWLAGQLAEDTHGLLVTGTDVHSWREYESRAPLFLETSRPGMFAVGDVGSGSVKRAAAAMGEGSPAVRVAFDRLQATGQVGRRRTRRR
jgi:thioredoxin reductase (NADPH)